MYTHEVLQMAFEATVRNYTGWSGREPGEFFGYRAKEFVARESPTKLYFVGRMWIHHVVS